MAPPLQVLGRRLEGPVPHRLLLIALKQADPCSRDERPAAKGPRRGDLVVLDVHPGLDVRRYVLSRRNRDHLDSRMLVVALDHRHEAAADALCVGRVGRDVDAKR